MSSGADLERGYRRMLSCYPRRFRDEHGEELLTVLLASASDGQHRPGLLESADLIRNGLGMRLRPDVSRSARQGWSDALAAYSLAAPVLLLLATVTGLLLQLARDPLHTVAAMSQAWPSLCLILGVEAAIIVLVMAGRRKTALAALVPAAALLWLAGTWNDGILLVEGSLLFTGLSLFLLEAVALITSPGPQLGRRLVHWGYWAFLLPAVAAAQIDPFMSVGARGSLAALGALVILILALNRLGRALRLSRYFRLLLAVTFYPTIFITATLDLGGFRLMNDLGHLGYPGALTLLFAGPLLCAGLAIGAAIRPRRHRII
jgi:hypothetical protein